jgi:hypothetical protein
MPFPALSVVVARSMKASPRDPTDCELLRRFISTHHEPALVVKTGKTEKLPDFPANGRAFGIAWSPDGQRLAYTWQPLDEELLKKDSIGREALEKETEGFLVIANADGSKAKTILTEKGKNATRLVLGWIDWR